MLEPLNAKERLYVYSKTTLSTRPFSTYESVKSLTRIASAVPSVLSNENIHERIRSGYFKPSAKLAAPVDNESVMPDFIANDNDTSKLPEVVDLTQNVKNWTFKTVAKKREVSAGSMSRAKQVTATKPTIAPPPPLPYSLTTVASQFRAHRINSAYFNVLHENSPLHPSQKSVWKDSKQLKEIKTELAGKGVNVNLHQLDQAINFAVERENSANLLRHGQKLLDFPKQVVKKRKHKAAK